MVTFGELKSSHDSSWAWRKPSICSSSVFGASPSRAIIETSPPAQKALPAPVTTIAPISGSRLQRLRQSIDPTIRSWLKALSLSGRLNVSVATLSATEVKITSSAIEFPFVFPGAHAPQDRSTSFEIRLSLFVKRGDAFLHVFAVVGHQ